MVVSTGLTVVTYSWISFDDANRHSLVDALGEPVGDGGADDAAADDGHVVMMVETLLQKRRFLSTPRTKIIKASRDWILDGSICEVGRFVRLDEGDLDEVEFVVVVGSHVFAALAGHGRDLTFCLIGNF